MEKAKHDSEPVGLAHRVEIFWKNGTVHLRTFKSFFTSSESNYFYVNRDENGIGHPCGYFGRLAADRYQRGVAFQDPVVRKLYARLESQLNSGMREIPLEEEHPLPSLEKMCEWELESCDMQDHIPFDVDVFEQKTLSYVCIPVVLRVLGLSFQSFCKWSID